MIKSIKSFFCLLMLLLISNYMIGQNIGQNNIQPKSNQMILNRTIKLNFSSDIKDIIIDVLDTTYNLKIGVNSVIKSGYLAVEIYDPKGNKKGVFLLESQIKSSKEESELVSGQIQKEIWEPIDGNWIIKLIPKKVVGDISIYTLQNQLD